MKIPAAFHEVSPYWAKKMGEAKTVSSLAGFSGVDSNGDYHSTRADGRRDMQNPQTCIVGEAWHDEFAKCKCSECQAFSQRFGIILDGGYDSRGNRKKLLVQNINDFTDHWRTVHNPMIDIDTELEIEPIRA